MKKIKLLINPFESLSETKLIVSGTIFFILGSLLAYFFSSRFDNFLHVSPVSDIKIYQPFVDNLLILICLSFFLFIAAMIHYPKTRPVDILATALIGNAPFYLISLSNIKDYGLKSTQTLMNLDLQNPESIPGNTLIYFMVVGLFSILLLVWIIALLYNGFKIAANARGIKAVVLFIAAILLTIATTSFLPLNY